MDDLMLVYRREEQLFTGNILYGDPQGGERGAVVISSFERVSFGLMFARLSEQITVFVEKDEKIGVTVRRTDLEQPAMRFDEETVLLLHADPVGVIRSLSPSPTKVFARRIDPATTSPLRVGYDALAATLGDEVYIRRRVDQVECPCCGRWADLKVGVTAPRGRVFSVDQLAGVCRSSACMAMFPATLRNDRWVSVRVTALLSDPEAAKFFFPREWNKPGPWVTREDLEKQHRDWTQIKKEFV